MRNTKRVSLVEFINPSRNYLTLIVLLVVLACVAVSLGFGMSSQSISETQRWVFVVFLIIFPIFGLILSIWLILRHFRKLYVSEDDDQIPWQITSSDRQKTKLNAAVDELAYYLSIPDSQMGDLRSAYIVAEDLALRNIEQEMSVPLKRYVTLEKAEFDAILIVDDLIKCLDVTFAVTPDVSQEKINYTLRKINAFKRTMDRLRPNTKVVLMLILVTQLDTLSEAELRSKVKTKFSETPVDVDIRFYDFETLQRTFAS